MYVKREIDICLMDSAIFKTIWTSVKRNFVSVLFPTTTVLTIYADLRHTARWKRQLAEQQTSETTPRHESISKSI
ncbi:uncharacterized protein [Mycetomoellerius zeteki]|uniref:uncharacterized protein n=1 Tax=Mycetomoellerius zeteki TaxID=64791 RepID=UPI00084E48BC|nr:PREDICTED: uncharacterized protein LOC108720527 [Trachymyrmex zeteki]